MFSALEFPTFGCGRDLAAEENRFREPSTDLTLNADRSQRLEAIFRRRDYSVDRDLSLNHKVQTLDASCGRKGGTAK
jgi:hypothetical protein